MCLVELIKKIKNAESSQIKALLWLYSIYSYYRNIHLVSIGNQNQNILFTPEQIRWSQSLQGKVPILNNTFKKKLLKTLR